MAVTCVDAVIQSLLMPWLSDGERQHAFVVDLRFIKMFLCCSASWDSDSDLRSRFTSIESIWQHERVSKDLQTLNQRILSKNKEKDVLNKLGKKILHSKRKIKKHSEHLISKSLTCRPLPSNEIQQFLDAIVNNMDYLVSCVADEILPVKEQIETLQEKVLMIKNLAEFTGMRCVESKALEYINIHVLTWANKAAFLTCLYWAGDLSDVQSRISLLAGDEDYWWAVSDVQYRMNLWVSDLLHKVNPCTPEFIDMCFAVIKLTKSSHSYIFLFEALVPSFVDLLLQNFLFTSNDDFRILREGLIYLITFVAGPPINYAENSELILFGNQIDAVLIEVSNVIGKFSIAKVAFTSGDSDIVKIMEMIDQVKEKIDTQCVQLSYSSRSYLPRTNGHGSVESLLVYLKDLEEVMSGHRKLVPSLKHQIFAIKDELKSLGQFLHAISELVSEDKELKHLWEEIISLAYEVELAIKQSFFIDRPLCLTYVIGKVQAIQTKVATVKNTHMFTINMLNAAAPAIGSDEEVIVFKQESKGLRVDEDFVGFKEETEELIDQLTRGTTELDIVSIVGMGGIGKTTLAKKLYKESSVTYYFHKRAFCTVSQVHKSKNILLEILSHLIGTNDNMRNMTEEDLADKLRKSLKGCRYLIVLDDIWDVNVWISVKDSFPNDHNGSRVIFTTRIYDVALKAKPNCIPYRLRFLTIDESWDLLQQKIFRQNGCPPFLFEVGRSIAENCKGLPLAVVIIAGLLANSQISLSWWQKVADNLVSYAFNEECWHILELSYKHLPDALKSCFLYLGAFLEDSDLRAKDITKLWAAEGFVPNSNKSSLNKTAKEYLNYLGDRSLLIVTERSLGGNTKGFRLHDVIREFCISKAREDHFLCLLNRDDDDDILIPLPYDVYRICIQGECGTFIDANPKGPAVHSLLCFEKGYKTNNCLTGSLFRNFRLIEVLDLRPVKSMDFPTAITMLVHLRYLALTCHCTTFPPTIANLRNLETLLIGSDKNFTPWPSIVNFPSTIWTMKRLKHLEVSRHGCCFDGLDDIASEAFSQLPDLEVLDVVRIRDKEEGEELLRRLPNVRKLGLKCEELPEELLNLRKLESLSIECVEGECSLILPSTLRKLSLVGFELPCMELPTTIGLDSLPFLQVLELDSCKFDDDRWDVEDEEFPTLKCLILDFSEIEYWNATIDSFPCLEKLVVWHCSQMVQIPPCFGEVPTLMALEVGNCNEDVKNSAIQIQEEQLDMGNDSFQLVIVS